MLSYDNTATIYISQQKGSDLNNGYEPEADGFGNGPIKSITRLETMLHTMRSGGIYHPVTVKFMGDYFMKRTIELGCEVLENIFSPDEKIRNITFESYGENRARLIGGKKLTGFQKDVFQGVECLSLFIPEVKEGKWHFTDLYVNGKIASRTRYPKEGTLTAVTTEVPDPAGNIHGGSKWFIARKEDLANVEGVENSIVSFYHYWIDEHTPVEDYDRETGKITMEYRSRMLMTTSYNDNPPKSITSDLHYYLENIPQTFSEPGEWYLDVKNGMLYYIPEDADVLPEDLEIFAPTLKQLVVLRGNSKNKVSGVRFQNLDFICSRGDYASTVTKIVSGEQKEEKYAADGQAVCSAYGAISFEYAEDCGIYHCNLSCLGVHAVEIKRGCQAIRLEENSFTNLGGGGVKIFGRRTGEAEEFETGHCVIRGNRIENCGKRYAAACGILAMDTAHNEIADNEICYLNYTGISVGWVWGYKPSASYGNIIRKNHIHHIGMGKLSDMGGIYTLGCQNGTIIEGNIIHDVRSAHYGGWGIYTDEGSSYIMIENNIVFNTKSNCFHQHYGSYNTVRNNIFAYGGNALVKVSRREEHLGVLLEHNTFISGGEPIYCFGYDGIDRAPCPGIRSSHNKIWDVSGNEPVMFLAGVDKKPLSLKEWNEIYGLDEGSVIEKPAASTTEMLQY